jgi:hypothetical protein
MSTVETKRLSKEFWAIDDEDWSVQRVTGYECPPNEKVWWVPKLGYSMTEGFHLFNSFDDAKAAGLRRLSADIQNLKYAYNRLLDARTAHATETGGG